MFCPGIQGLKATDSMLPGSVFALKATDSMFSAVTGTAKSYRFNAVEAAIWAKATDSMLRHALRPSKSATDSMLKNRSEP